MNYLKMKNVLLLIVLILSSCGSNVDSFYKKSTIGDQKVLPLLKPYKLVTPIRNPLYWHLEFNRPVYNGFGHISQTNVCKINVIKDIIFGHCMDYNCYPNQYFAIIKKGSVERLFDSEDEWKIFLAKVGVDSPFTYEVIPIYNSFRDDFKTLPWIKNTY